MATERKNIKRNKTRPKVIDYPFRSSIQRNYGRIKKKVVSENQMKLL